MRHEMSLFNSSQLSQLSIAPGNRRAKKGPEIMKTNCIVIVAAAITTSFAGLPLKAQDMSSEKSPPMKQDTAKERSLDPAARKASDIIGMEVMDSQDHWTGKVKDMIIDLQGGRIAEVILDTSPPMPPSGAYPEPSTAGTLDQNMTPVPPACLAYSLTGKALCLNTAREDLKEAPTLTMRFWEDAATTPKIEEVYHRYAIPMPTFGNLERATLLLGGSVINDQDKKLGKVDNLVLDLHAGRVEKVILASGGFLGIDKELTAVAPQSFVYDADRQKLSLNMTPESLQNALHFAAPDWRISVTVQTGSSTAGYTSSDDASSTDMENSSDTENSPNTESGD
jgi:sporulation protein YlmC with PRC-barrel domain